MKTPFVILLIIAFLALAACKLFGEELPPHSPTPQQEIEFGIEMAPGVPPSRFPPLPVPDGEGWSVGADNVYTAYVMSVEYQTNGVDGTIMEFQYVPVTNYVPRYPKLLYVQATFCETVGGEYRDIGQEMVFKLADATNGFYSVKLRIE